MFAISSIQASECSITYRPSLNDARKDTLVVLICGLIGSGKSELRKLLSSNGYPVISYDDVAESVIWTRGNLPILTVELGRTIVHTHDGQITYNTEAVHGLLFDSAHPATAVARQEFLRNTFNSPILAEVKARIATALRSGNKIVFVEHSTGLEDGWVTGISADKTVCLFTSEKKRASRLQGRGVSGNVFQEMRRHSFSDPKRAAHASILITNNGTVSDLAITVEQLLTHLGSLVK